MIVNESYTGCLYMLRFYFFVFIAVSQLPASDRHVPYLDEQGSIAHAPDIANTFGVDALLAPNTAMQRPIGKLPGLDTEFKVIRPSKMINKQTGKSVETPIYYHVYYNTHYGTPQAPFKGVIINAYGAGVQLPVAPQFLLPETYLASQGYLVYVLNVRGTTGFGNQHVNAQGDAAGIASVARDVAYFATLIKTQSQDAKGQAVALSDRVSNLPVYFEGTSFGGYLALFMATSDDNVFYGPSNSLSVPINESMDGYIALAPVSDFKLDALSHTTAGDSRYPGAAASNSNYVAPVREWISNFTKGRDYVADDSFNREISPLYHVSKIKRPILLLHGLKDRNTSPRQSFEFFSAADRAGTSKYITLHFQLDYSHDWPQNELLHFSRAMYCFLSGMNTLVGQNVIHNSPPEIDKNRERVKAANFLMRGLNPDISFANYEFIHTLLEFHFRFKKYYHEYIFNSSTPTSTFDLFRKDHLFSYIKAIIARKEFYDFVAAKGKDVETFNIDDMTPSEVSELRKRDADSTRKVSSRE